MIIVMIFCLRSLCLPIGLVALAWWFDSSKFLPLARWLWCGKFQDLNHVFTCSFALHSLARDRKLKSHWPDFTSPYLSDLSKGQKPQAGGQKQSISPLVACTTIVFEWVKRVSEVTLTPNSQAKISNGNSDTLYSDRWCCRLEGSGESDMSWRVT